ncbi:hypothetical protein [Acidovorax sp. JG5]|nr:hypothetical protein [Acidovorax sp. JG5]
MVLRIALTVGIGKFWPQVRRSVDSLDSDKNDMSMTTCRQDRQ